jgi:hypothetical protein
MTKSKYLLVIAAITILLFLSETSVYADIVSNQYQTTIGLLLIAAIIIAVIVLIAWKIIHTIRRKNKS